MVLGVHFADGINNHTLLVDDIRCAQCALGLAAVHLLHAPGLISLENCEVGVGNEGERQLILLLETLVRGSRVAAHAHHGLPECEETLVIVPQVAGLGSAARCAVLGVEIKHQLLAGKIRQANLVPVLVIALKPRGLCSNL